MHIYVLKLEGGKYYVGKTNNPTFRLEEHFDSNGSAWTMKYKPIEVFHLIPDCDDYDEDKYTRMYMDKFGVDNVRGGSWTKLELDNKTREVLTQMSKSTNDQCFRCGRTGHFSKQCYAITKADGTPIDKKESKKRKRN